MSLVLFNWQKALITILPKTFCHFALASLEDEWVTYFQTLSMWNRIVCKENFWIEMDKTLKMLKKSEEAASLDFEHNVKKSRRAATQKKTLKNRVFYAQKPTGRHYKPLVLLLLSPWGHSNSVPAASLMSTTSEENIHVWEEMYCKRSCIQKAVQKEHPKSNVKSDTWLKCQ